MDHPPPLAPRCSRPLVQGILTYLAARRRVVFIDEWGTSAHCNKCEARLAPVAGRPRDKACGKCGVINRDRWELEPAL